MIQWQMDFRLNLPSIIALILFIGLHSPSWGDFLFYEEGEEIPASVLENFGQAQAQSYQKPATQQRPAQQQRPQQSQHNSAGQTRPGLQAAGHFAVPAPGPSPAASTSYQSKPSNFKTSSQLQHGGSNLKQKELDNKLTKLAAALQSYTNDKSGEDLFLFGSSSLDADDQRRHEKEINENVGYNAQRLAEVNLKKQLELEEQYEAEKARLQAAETERLNQQYQSILTQQQQLQLQEQEEAERNRQIAAGFDRQLPTDDQRMPPHKFGHAQHTQADYHPGVAAGVGQGEYGGSSYYGSAFNHGNPPSGLRFQRRWENPDYSHAPAQNGPTIGNVVTVLFGCIGIYLIA